MTRIRIAILSAALLAISLASSAQGVKRMEGAYLEQQQKRDSILIADQLKYGVKLSAVKEGSSFSFPDWDGAFGDTLVVVRNWQLDTLKVSKAGKKSGAAAEYEIDASLIIAPFEEGQYTLPEIMMQRTLPGGGTDTLVFDALEMDVKTMPVDTANFVINDIKGQIRYPLTFRECLPYILGAILLAALIALAIWLIRRHLAKRSGLPDHIDPPYIVALRRLEGFRDSKYWAPESQKAFYSGITDTLRVYIADSFGIDACEMTTAEIFEALRGNDRIPQELVAETRALFEVADFVKFAKHLASDEDNAKALPSAVRFVTSTYQSELDAEGESSERTEPAKE